VYKTEYLIVTALTSFATLFLAAFVFFKGPKKKLNYIYSAWALCVGLWSFFLVLNILAPTQEMAALWCHALHIWAIILPAVYVHFVLLFLGRYEKKQALVYALYIASAILVVIDFTPWFLTAVFREKFNFFVTKPLLIYPIHLFFFVGSVFYVYFELIRGLIHAKGAERKKNQYFLIATVSAYSGGLSNYFINYDFLIFPMYPYGNLGVLLYVAVIGLAIIRYRLLDIEVIIKKTLVFAGLFGVIMAAISIITVITQGYLGQVLGIGPMTRQILSVLIAMALFDPTRKYLTYLTDSYLFQRKEDFKIILNRLAKNIVTILDLHAVGETVLTTLQESLRLETGAVLIRNEKGGGYSILSSFDCDDPRKEFSSDSEFIRYFSDPGQIVNSENPEEKKNYPLAVQSAMDSLKTVIAVPLFVQSGLAGLLLMGKKKSDQEFTQEEIGYLPTVASQTAIALKNAQLVDDVICEREQKIIAQNKAEQVNYASSLSHETGNALVGITSTSQNISGGLVQDLRKLIKHCESKLDATLRKRYEEIADKIERFAKIIEQNSEKVRVIIKTATGGLKNNRSEKEDISFRFVWNHAKKEANINDVRYDGQMPDPFIVFGNTSLLTRVLVNMFINSRDAMLPIAGERCIHLDASYRDFEGRQVAWAEYWDDGPGVPEELFAKVFEQGFTTKPKPQGPMGLDSGYGQGLYYCRKFIEDFHGGRLWLEKKEGCSSKFVFWIPADKEGNGENK